MPILAIDDDPDVRRALAALLSANGIEVHEALVCEVHDDEAAAGRVLFAGAGSIAASVRAGRFPGCEYVELPADPAAVLDLLRVPCRTAAAGAARAVACTVAVSRDFIALSPDMRALRDRAHRVGGLDSTVLITGESGTGKEVVARAIFRAALHRRGEFVPVNCGAIPDDLIETELFGHKKGAFTHAVADRKGMVETANGGILFLDEIGEMPLAMQVSLLRFLDAGEFRRVGDPITRRADVRVIAATNRPLQEDICAGRFRLDLFYRLNVVALHVPPLRDRKEDIGALALDYLDRISPRLRTSVTGMSNGALRALEDHLWPGNVRELQNIVETLTIDAAGSAITAEEVRAVLAQRKVAGGPLLVPQTADERCDIVEMVSRSGGNQTLAAAAMGINRTTLWRRQRRQQETPVP